MRDFRACVFDFLIVIIILEFLVRGVIGKIDSADVGIESILDGVFWSAGEFI